MSATAVTIVTLIVGSCFAAAAILSVIRIVRGPSLIDRMAASDTLLTVLMCVLVAEMVINGHLHTLPLVVGLAMTASVGTLAVARFASRAGRRKN